VPQNADAGTIRRAWAGPGSPTLTTLTRAVLRNRWSASMPPMNGPAYLPTPQFGPFTEALS
jgi:hypothetical protein